jgi:chromosome segregation ATPase
MTQPDLQELRESLARRLQEKAELERQVRAVQSQFEEEVAPLQEEVLRLQMERLKEAAQARMRSARLRNAYHDAQTAYEQFRERRAHGPQPVAASDEDLKATYRRATKRCHPDAVADSYHEEAAATFQALESAYDANHPEAVRAIAEDLDTWGFPRAPSAPTDRSASETAAFLRRAVSDLDASIERLQTTEAYQTMTEPDGGDADSVVGARKRALQRRLHELKRRQRARF